MPIYNSVLETIGRTPLIKLNRVTEGLDATIALKAEFFNPLGSVKDRIGLAMIESGRKGWEDHKGHDHCRADIRQHRHCAGVCRGGEGLQADFDHAGEHVAGTANAARTFWVRSWS